MNEFLERIKIIAKYNPGLLNDDFYDIVYTELIGFNLGHNQEKFKNISNMFSKWIDRNNVNERLRTFIDNRYPYFCQFVNRGAKPINKDAIKLYIPLDEEHLYEGVNKLFTFITNMGIEHNSKVGSEIRNDNVVIRVSNIKDAETIINYVKNDKYLSEGLLNVNPFTINLNGVGIAMDGMRSYNIELSKSIANFTKILSEKNRLEDLNVDTFNEYLNNVRSNDRDLNMINDIQKRVTAGQSFDMSYVKDIFSKYNGNVNNINKEGILKEAIIETYNKYQSIDHVIHAIARFRYNGDACGFTRNNGARARLEMGLSLEDVNNILNNYPYYGDNNIEAYINNCIGLNNTKDDKYQYLVNAYKDTYNKYGDRQADLALRKYILNKEVKYITNSNGARTNLEMYLKDSDIMQTLKNGMNIDSYCSLEDICETFINEMRQLNMSRGSY